MNKVSAFIIGLLFCCQLSFSKSVNWQWAKSGIGPNNSYNQNVSTCTDTSGNVFVVGYFQNAYIKLDSTTTLYNSGAYSAFIAKYSSSGKLLWAKGSNVSGQQTLAKASAIAADAAGNIYVTGFYSGYGTVGFDNFNLPSYNFRAVFLLKYDPIGNLVGINGWGDSESNTEGKAIAVSAAGNIYLTGYFSGSSIDFGGGVVIHNSSGNKAIFITCFDTDGFGIWGQTPRTAGEGDDEGDAICTDVEGNIYVAGQYSNYSITFGNTTFTNNNYQPRGFIAKYDSTGTVIWANSAASSTQYELDPKAIAIDAQNNVYVTGAFGDSTANFGQLQAHGATNLINFFLVKYDASGHAIWVKDPGTYGMNISQFSEGWCLAFNTLQNRLYLGGGFEGPGIHIDSVLLSPPPGQGNYSFIVVIEPNGLVDCSTVLASGSSSTFGIATDNKGNGYMASTFAAGSFILGADSFSGQGCIAAKFICQDCALTGIDYRLSASIICPGDSAEIDLSGNSGINITPANYVTWVDSVHAILKPVNTTIFNIQGYTSCGIYKTQSFTLPVLCSPVNLVSDKTIICPSDSAHICTTTGFVAYNWSNGDTSACIYTGLAGNYSLTVSENGNCSATSNEINISTYPSSPVGITVNGDTLSGYGFNNYHWLLNGVAIPGANSDIYIALNSGSYTLQITDTNGCVATSGSVLITGVQELLPENDIAVFPNPTRSGWQLSVNTELVGCVIEIFDATGRLVYKSLVANNTLPITISAIGVYELRISSNRFNIIKKIVKI